MFEKIYVNVQELKNYSDLGVERLSILLSHEAQKMDEFDKVTDYINQLGNEKDCIQDKEILEIITRHSARVIITSALMSRIFTGIAEDYALFLGNCLTKILEDTEAAPMLKNLNHDKDFRAYVRYISTSANHDSPASRMKALVKEKERLFQVIEKCKQRVLFLTTKSPELVVAKDTLSAMFGDSSQRLFAVFELIQSQITLYEKMLESLESTQRCDVYTFSENNPCHKISSACIQSLSYIFKSDMKKGLEDFTGRIYSIISSIIPKNLLGSYHPLLGDIRLRESLTERRESSNILFFSLENSEIVKALPISYISNYNKKPFECWIDSLRKNALQLVSTVKDARSSDQQPKLPDLYNYSLATFGRSYPRLPLALQVDIVNSVAVVNNPKSMSQTLKSDFLLPRPESRRKKPGIDLAKAYSAAMNEHSFSEKQTKTECEKEALRTANPIFAIKQNISGSRHNESTTKNRAKNPAAKRQKMSDLTKNPETDQGVGHERDLQLGKFISEQLDIQEQLFSHHINHSLSQRNSLLPKSNNLLPSSAPKDNQDYPSNKAALYVVKEASLHSLRQKDPRLARANSTVTRANTTVREERPTVVKAIPAVTPRTPEAAKVHPAKKQRTPFLVNVNPTVTQKESSESKKIPSVVQGDLQPTKATSTAAQEDYRVLQEPAPTPVNAQTAPKINLGVQHEDRSLMKSNPNAVQQDVFMMQSDPVERQEALISLDKFMCLMKEVPISLQEEEVYSMQENPVSEQRVPNSLEEALSFAQKGSNLTHEASNLMKDTDVPVKKEEVSRAQEIPDNLEESVENSKEKDDYQEDKDGRVKARYGNASARGGYYTGARSSRALARGGHHTAHKSTRYSGFGGGHHTAHKSTRYSGFEGGHHTAHKSTRYSGFGGGHHTAHKSTRYSGFGGGHHTAHKSTRYSGFGGGHHTAHKSGPYSSSRKTGAEILSCPSHFEASRASEQRPARKRVDISEDGLNNAKLNASSLYPRKTELVGGKKFSGSLETRNKKPLKTLCMFATHQKNFSSLVDLINEFDKDRRYISAHNRGFFSYAPHSKTAPNALEIQNTIENILELLHDEKNIRCRLSMGYDCILDFDEDQQTHTIALMNSYPNFRYIGDVISSINHFSSILSKMSAASDCVLADGRSNLVCILKDIAKVLANMKKKEIVIMPSQYFYQGKVSAEIVDEIKSVAIPLQGNPINVVERREKDAENDNKRPKTLSLNTALSLREDLSPISEDELSLDSIDSVKENKSKSDENAALSSTKQEDKSGSVTQSPAPRLLASDYYDDINSDEEDFSIASTSSDKELESLPATPVDPIVESSEEKDAVMKDYVELDENDRLDLTPEDKELESLPATPVDPIVESSEEKDAVMKDYVELDENDRLDLTPEDKELESLPATPANEVTVTCEKSTGDDAIIMEDAVFDDDRSTLTSAEQEVILSSPTPTNEVTVTCEKSTGDDAIIMEDAVFDDDRSTLTSAEQEVILSSPTPTNEVTVTCEKSTGDDAIIMEDAVFDDDRSTLTSAEQEVILSSPTPTNEVTVTCEKSTGDDAIIMEDAVFDDDRSTLTSCRTGGHFIFSNSNE